MMIRYYLYKLTVAGALASCARAVDDRGGAPLADNPGLHINQKVTVVGRVEEVRGEQTFLLKENGLTGNEPILVIAQHPVRQIVMGRAVVYRDEWLKVYGTVRQLDVPAMERAFRFNLDPDFEAMYADQPVVVTDWISQP